MAHARARMLSTHVSVESVAQVVAAQNAQVLLLTKKAKKPGSSDVSVDGDGASVGGGDHKKAKTGTPAGRAGAKP